MRINEATDGLRELLTAALESHLSLLSVVAELRHGGSPPGQRSRRAHHGGRDLRHEFRVHARAALELGYPVVIGGMGFLCVALFRAFKRTGWL